MFDIHFLNKKGCVLNKELFYELYNFWNEYHGKNRRSELNMTSDAFFNNALKLDYQPGLFLSINGFVFTSFAGSGMSKCLVSLRLITSFSSTPMAFIV